MPVSLNSSSASRNAFGLVDQTWRGGRIPNKHCKTQRKTMSCCCHRSEVTSQKGPKKAIATQITTAYKQLMQNTVVEDTPATLKQCVCVCVYTSPHQPCILHVIFIHVVYELNPLCCNTVEYPSFVCLFPAKPR